MSQANTNTELSVKVSITVFCRGCRILGNGTRPFKGYATPVKERNTKSISSMGLTYHLRTKKNEQCRLVYKNENLFDKRKQKFDYSTSILATPSKQSTVRHSALKLGLSKLINILMRFMEKEPQKNSGTLGID